LPRFPAALLVVVLSIVASWSLDLAAHGVSIAGALPADLPEFAFPRVGGHELAQLAGLRGCIFLVGFSDSIHR
jgi:SulP family sulfate permease